MRNLIAKFDYLKALLEGKKTYLVALVTFVASLHGAHGSPATFLNSANGLHAELAVLVSTLRAGIAKRH